MHDWKQRYEEQQRQIEANLTAFHRDVDKAWRMIWCVVIGMLVIVCLAMRFGGK